MAVTGFELEGSIFFSLLSKVSGAGIVRVVACVVAMGGVTWRDGGEADDDGSDGDDSGSEGCVGTEYCEPCEWLRTSGGSSVGMGGGIGATVQPDDFDILDEIESRE